MQDGHIKGEKMADIQELIPDPAILITGLRDTGYDFNTSLADIVDNSVDANSKKIDIRIELRTNGDPLVTVVDDGCGMNREELLDGMRYGSSDSQRKDPKRLGKFGLGLKTASTAFCRRLSVISKAKAEEKYYMATWDLDLVARDNKWKLELSREEDIPRLLLSRIKSFASEGHGTLVVWDKIDRMSTGSGKVSKKAVDSYAKGFSQYATMIYHRFLDSDDTRARNITMFINGIMQIPFDPFCLKERRDDDTGTILYLEDKKECEIQLIDGTNHSANFSLKGYVLPFKDDFSSEAARSAARITNRNMGFWVYRENRLIAAGDWLGIRVPDPHDSLCRIEFSFDHELDAAFKIDIKKSKINLSPDLLDWLKDWSSPVQRFASDRYRGKEKAIIANSPEISHKEADASIQRNEDSLSLARVSIDRSTISSDSNTAVANVENVSTIGNQPIAIRIVIPQTNDKGVTVIPKENLEDGVLWSPTINNKHHAVMINSTHPFYQKVYFPNRNDRNVIAALDYMLWALSETEWGLQTTGSRDHFQDFKINVSRILKSLSNELPDPEV